MSVDLTVISVRVACRILEWRLPDLARKYLVLIGCVLLIMPVSVSVYFGNFIIYISSYYHVNASKVTVWIDPLWLSSAFKILQPVGMVLAGYVEKKTKSLNTGIALGAFLQSSSVLLSYWAIAEPLSLLLTFGIIQGIAGGILLALPYKKAAEVFPEKRGFSFGIISTGPSIFPLLHMVLSYYLINPDNRATDIQIGNIRYFTDDDVINRVPPFFLKMGLFTSALQISGMLLILLKKEDHLSKEKSQSTEALVKADEQLVSRENETDPTYSSDTVEDKYDRIVLNNRSEFCGDCDRQKLTDNVVVEAVEECRHGKLNSINGCPRSECSNVALVVDDDSSEEERGKNYEQVRKCSPSRAVDSAGTEDCTTEISDDEEADEPKDLSPKEMLTSFSFWKTWLIFALMGHTFFIHLNLYKQFGLTVINDDNLLVMAGTVSTFVLMIFRPLVGIMSDRFGMKPILVITCACSNLFMTMMPITLYTWPPLYIVFVALEFYAVSSVKVFYYMAPIIMFGPTHFATNVGLMSSSQWVTFFVGPVIVPTLITSIGWAYVMMSGAAAAAVAFFLSVSLPESKKRTQQKT
ncbi:hypothetical protein Btru_001787 [Bulinus truncatus]|nr:hypothetical protein Btru_001787 [Bulinus truncatus]